MKSLNCDVDYSARPRPEASRDRQDSREPRILRAPSGQPESLTNQSGSKTLFVNSRRLILRHVLVSLAFAVTYLLFNLPDVVFFSRIGFVAWYPAVGLIMAFTLGLSPWYAVLACFCDAAAGRVIYGQPVTSFSNTVDAVGIALCYGTAASVLRGRLKIDLGLRRRGDVVRYVFVSSTAAAGATVIGVACLIADHGITWREYKQSAIGWFLGDTVGLVGIAPFLLIHVFPYVRKWLGPKSDHLSSDRAHPTRTTSTLAALAEACAQVLTILAVLWVMFGTKDGRYDHFYLCFIPIIWIAMRQGVRRVVTGLLAINFGIVVAMHLFPPTAALFAKVALLMLVMSAVGLIVGSEVSERHRLAIDLNEQTTYLDSLIQNSPLGIVVLDPHGQVELTNPAFERLFQYKRHELGSIDIGSMMMPGDDATDSEQLVSQVFAGATLRRTVRQRRRDGEMLDLALHGVPLLLSGEVRGAYLICEDISQQIKASEAQREHAESLNRLVGELELRTMQITVLNEMARLLECSATVEEASAVVAKLMQRLFPGASSGALYLFKSSRDLVEAAIRWGKIDTLAPTFPQETCWSLRLGQPHWSDPPEGSLSCQHLTESSTMESLCVPLVAQGSTIGVLHIGFQIAPTRAEPFRDSDQRLAISAASQIALSLASLQLRETLREQAIRDPLTRLFNRRFLEESFVRELELASRKRQTIAVLLLDLDHFKRFNDSFGHEAGDVVLQALADLFRAFFRATDICCRYGGEEFAIILPESSSVDAGIRAEALRLEVKRIRLQYKKQSLGEITLSAGVAAFPEHGSTSVDLLRIADHCLYESKSRGRDLVTVARLPCQRSENAVL